MRYVLTPAAGSGGMSWRVRVDGATAGTVTLDPSNPAGLPYGSRRLLARLDLQPGQDTAEVRRTLLAWIGHYAVTMDFPFVEYRRNGVPIEQLAERVDLAALDVEIAPVSAA